jgi:predicted TIM-barrel fold metal-dependent hydrolase
MGLGGIMPLEWFVWGSDFPHSVCTFPNSLRYIDEAFAGVDAAMRRKIVLENAASFYGLDLDADITPTPSI